MEPSKDLAEEGASERNGCEYFMVGYMHDNSNWFIHNHARSIISHVTTCSSDPPGDADVLY